MQQNGFCPTFDYRMLNLVKHIALHNKYDLIVMKSVITNI
jgi:hypothetical protein